MTRSRGRNPVVLVTSMVFHFLRAEAVVPQVLIKILHQRQELNFYKNTKCLTGNWCNGFAVFAVVRQFHNMLVDLQFPLKYYTIALSPYSTA